MNWNRGLITTSLLTTVVAPAAWAATSVTGTATLSVEDVLTEKQSSLHTIDGTDGDAFQLNTADGTSATASYSIANVDKTTSVVLDTTNASGASQGTAFSGASFTFTTEAESFFSFSVESAMDALPSDYHAEFAGFIADAYSDPDAEGGLGGSIGLDGVFNVSGVLPAGVYQLVVNHFEADNAGTPMDGSATASLTLTAAHAPVPAAALMGLVTLCSSAFAGTLRRSRRRA